MSTVPTLQIHVNATDNGLNELRLKVQGLRSEVQKLDLDSPLAQLRSKMANDIAEIKNQLLRTLPAATASGAEAFAVATKQATASMVAMMESQTKDLVTKVEQHGKRVLSEKQKQDKEIADANQDAIKSGAFIKSTPTSQLGMVNKALGALSEGADAESVLKRYNSRVMEAVYNLPAFIAANEKAAAALKSRAAAGAKVETDEEKRRAQLKAADADGIKNSKFAEDSAVSRLKTVRQAFGALQREVSELTVIKRFGTDVLKATKDLASFEEAVKKANEEASAKKSTPQKQKSLDQLKEDNARLRTVASQRKVIQKEFEEANAAHTEKISSEDLRRHKLRGGAIFAEQKLDLDREAQQQAMRVRDAKFSDMSARQQLQQVRGVAAQIRKGVSEENIAKAFAPSAIAGVSDLAGFVKRAEDFRNANKKIKDTSVSDAKKADDLLQAQRDKNRAFEKLDAEQRLALAEKVAASRKALNSEAFIARKYAPLAIEASNDLPATRLKAEEFKAAQEQVKRLKALDDDRLRDLQRAGRERLAQEIKDAADVKALRKSQEREYDADVRKNNSFRKATPAAQLKTLTLARGELELGASEASVLKNYGSQVLESTKNIHAFEAANLKGSFALKGMTLDMNDAHAAARGLAGGFGQLWLTYGNVLPLLAGAAISAGFVAVVKQGAQVQNTFATIGALSEETDESVGKLNAQMLEMARSGPYGPREIAEAMKTLALAGLNAKEVSQSVGDVLRFAIAGDTDIQTSADVLTTVGVAFKMTADSYGYISDVIAKAAAISKSSVESIGSAFKTASVINAQYGASLEDVGLGLAFLANSGIQRTAAGTGLRNFYVDVLGRTPKAREELEAMAKSIGVVSIAMDTATGKALPLPQVLKNLNEAYKLMTPEREYKSKQDVFSERGGKVPFPLLDALNSAVKESNTTFDNFLDESMAKIENAAGFAAIAAAKMALTPLNQMKAVSSSLQATIVETFDSIAPQIIATTSLLREAFKSEEFKRGIVLAATALADFTMVMVKHADTIVIAASAYLALQVALGVQSLFVGLAAKAALASTALTAFSLATGGVSDAKSKAASASGRLVGGLSTVLGVVSKLAFPITAAWGAWELYSYWTDKSNKATVEGDTPRQALIKSLEVEAKRVEDVNKAKRLNITYDELMQKNKINETLASSSEKVDKAKADYEKALKRQEDYATKGGIRNSAPEPSRLREMAADAAKKKAIYDAAAAADRDEVVRLRNVSAQVKAGHQVAKDDAKKLAEEQALADAKRKKVVTSASDASEADPEKEVKAARVAYDRLMTEANAYYNNHKKTLDESFRHEQEIIKAKTSARLITEGEGYVQSLASTLAYEQQQNALIEKAYADRMAELDKVNDNFKGNVKEYSAFLDQHLKEEQKAQDTYQETSKQLANATKQRKELASIALSKIFSDDAEELRKLSVEVDNYSEGMLLKSSADKLSAGMSPAERAGYEAKVAFTEKFLSKINSANESLERQQSLIASLQVAYDSYDNRDVDGPSRADVGQELTRRLADFDTRKKAFSELSASVSEKAELSGAQASAKVLVAEYDKANTEIKDKLSSAIFDAATSGGKGLKDQLKKAVLDFSRDKFKLVMDVILNPVSKALAGFLSPAAAQAAGMSESGSGGGFFSAGKGIYDALNGGFAKLGASVTSQFSSFATSSIGQSMGLSSAATVGNNASAFVAPQMTSAASSMATAAGSLAASVGGMAAGLGLRSAISGDMSMGRGIDNFQKVGVAALSFIPGIGPVLGAIAGAGAGLLNRAFGMGPKNTVAEGLSGKFGASTGSELQTYSSWQQKGGWFRSDKSGTDYAPVQEALDKFLDLSIVTIASKTKAYAAAVGAGAEAVSGYTEDINVSLKGLTTEEQNKALEEAVAKFGDNTALQVEGLSKYVREGESASAVLAALANALTTVNSALGTVNLTLYESTLQGAEASTKLLAAFGGADKFVSGMNSYYENYFSAEEKRANVIKGVTKTLNDAGGSFTEQQISSMSKKDFRAEFEKKSNTNEFLAAMISVESAVANLNPEIETLEQALLKLTNPIRTVEEIAQSLFSLGQAGANLQADLKEAQGDKAGARRTRSNLETANFTDAEVTLYRYNESLKDQITVATESTSLQERLSAATDSAAKAAERARDAISYENKGLYDKVLILEQAKPLQERLTAATDSTAQAAKRAREAIDPMNLALYDQTLAAEQAKPLQERLTAATDTTAQAAERARGAIDPMNLALYDTVLAVEANKAAMESFNSSVAGTIAKFNTPEQNKKNEYASIAEGLRKAGFSDKNYSSLASDLESANKDQIKSVVQKIFDGLGEGSGVEKENLRVLVDRLGDLKVAEAEESLKAAKESLEKKEKAQSDALSMLEKSIEREKKLIQVRLDLAEKNVTTIKSIFDLLKSNVTELYNLVDSTRIQAGVQSTTFIDDALRAAQTTGYLPEKEALEDAIAASRKNIDSTVYTSQNAQDIARLELAGKLSQLKDISGRQLTEAERQVASAKAQLEYYENLLITERAQVDALLGLNTSILSIPDALANLLRANNDLSAARAASATTAPAPAATTASRVSDYSIEAMIYGTRGKGNGEAGNKELYDWAYQWKDSGVTLARLNEIANVPAGTAESWAKANGLPAFADGGDHAGGWAMVGERGPELAYMPAARIYNAPDTNRILSNRNSDHAVAALAVEMARVVARLDKLVKSSADTADTLNEVTENGNAMRIVTL